MAHDAFDPGPDGSYPFFPRLADGTPFWSDDPKTDGVGVLVNGRWVAPMPRGIRHVRRDGDQTKIDVTPRHTVTDALINPPVRSPQP